MATITSPRADSPAPTPRITSPSVPSIASPLSTPTSSVRTSLELPRPDAASTTNSTTSQRPRNRAALRDYYNLKSRAPASSALARTNSAASASSVNSDSTSTSTLPSNNTSSDTSPLLAQLDTANFNATSFIETLLKTSSLRDILRTESALVSEIRTLDGERKALVYDNYSKLIKAVGTIGEMQRGMQRRPSNEFDGGKRLSVGMHAGQQERGGLDGVEALQEKLGNLETEVRELRPVEEGNAEMEGYEEEVRQRKKVKAQKELVKWVLAAPGRLEGIQDREEAEMEWATVKMLLDRWEGTKGVDEIRRKGEEVMKVKMETARKAAERRTSEEGGDDATT